MSELPPALKMAHMLSGYWVSQAVYTAARLGIADRLQQGPRSVEDLAREAECKPDGLYRLLRALASVGVFAENRQGQFELTSLAELLRSDVPGSMHALALMQGEEHYLCWGQLYDCVKTGDNAFEKLYGMPIFDYMSQNPEPARIFDAAMTGIHGQETGAVLDSFDFSGIGTLADIGGGNGSNLSAILKKYPTMQGILFDLPHVIERARPQVAAAGVDGRCQFVSGNFFEAVPAGADAYLMRHIIHDWDDEKAHAILQSCRAAMPAHGRLLLVESVILPGNDPYPPKFLDLTMMLIPGGKERTEQEYRQLLSEAGFELQRIVNTPAHIDVLEATPR